MLWMGSKLTMSTGPIPVAMLNYQRVSIWFSFILKFFGQMLSYHNAWTQQQAPVVSDVFSGWTCFRGELHQNVWCFSHWIPLRSNTTQHVWENCNDLTVLPHWMVNKGQYHEHITIPNWSISDQRISATYQDLYRVGVICRRTCNREEYQPWNRGQPVYLGCFCQQLGERCENMILQ